MSGVVDINAPPLSLVSREEWGALPTTVEFENLRKPCSSLRLWKYSDTPPCTTREECVRIVQEIQQRDIKQGLGDIRFNFMIGGDGNVYEGRGFDKMPPKDEIVSEIWGKYLELGFIGDHRSTERSHLIYYIVSQIFEAAVKNGSLKFEANILPEE